MKSYNVESKNNQLVITIDKRDFNQDYLINLLDRLKLEAIVSKSKMTKKQVQQLSNETKASWWDANKDEIKKRIQK